MQINWNNVEVYTTDVVEGIELDGFNRPTAQAIVDMAARQGVTASIRQTGETVSGRAIYSVARV